MNGPLTRIIFSHNLTAGDVLALIFVHSQLNCQFLALPKPPDVKVCFEGDAGLLSGLSQDKIWIDHSTTGKSKLLTSNYWILLSFFCVCKVG